MSELDDVKSRADTARGAIDAVTTLVEAAMTQAQDTAERAAALGVEGVASTVRAAHDNLETTASGVGAAHDAGESAHAVLAGITTELNANDVVERLGGVLDLLDQAGSALDGGTGAAEEANNLAQEAEVEALVGLTGDVVGGVVDARAAIEQARSHTEQYQQMVKDLNQGN